MGFYRWQEHPTNFKNQLVEVFGDGCGRRGGELRGSEGLPVHHSDKYTGMEVFTHALLD